MSATLAPPAAIFDNSNVWFNFTSWTDKHLLPSSLPAGQGEEGQAAEELKFLNYHYAYSFISTFSFAMAPLDGGLIRKKSLELDGTI